MLDMVLGAGGLKTEETRNLSFQGHTPERGKQAVSAEARADTSTSQCAKHLQLPRASLYIYILFI